MTRKQAVGKWGERLAEDYLVSRGFSLVDRNVRTQYGEIDLVFKSEDDVLLFIEVKTRTSQTYGQPEIAITSQKKEHMIRSAEAYLLQHPEFTGDWRIDVISIYRSGAANPEIIWFENALS